VPRSYSLLFVLDWAMLGACPTLTVLLRRAMAGHLLCSRPRKNFTVFQRIRLWFFAACGRATACPLFASSRMTMPDKLLARTLLSTVALLVTLTGCASTQEAGDGSDAQAPTFLQVKAAPNSFEGQSVVFGGKVLTARRQKDGTRIEVLQLPLDRSTRPGYDLTQSQGRFIAINREFLDPATVPIGTRITVTGEVSGSITLPLDETDYTYPVIEIKHVQVWAGLEDVAPPYPPLLYGARSLLGALLGPLLAAVAVLVSRMLKMSLFSPAQPWCAKTHLSPGVVLASFRPSTGTRPPH
jgi:outer membrane lipoprotein